MKNNITVGQSSQKQHLRNGASTSCNRRTSSINNNEFEDFKDWALRYEQDCCKRCLAEFYSRLNKKKGL